jgi:hypothetical protein
MSSDKITINVEDLPTQPAAPVAPSSPPRTSWAEPSRPSSPPPPAGGRFIATFVVLNFVLTFLLAIGVAYLAYTMAPKQEAPTHEIPTQRQLDWKPEPQNTIVPKPPTAPPTEPAKTALENTTLTPVEPIIIEEKGEIPQPDVEQGEQTTENVSPAPANVAESEPGNQ